MRDRSLHFCVRHPGYSQDPGYPHFMNHVLNALDADPPDSLESLFLRTEALMANETTEAFDPDDDLFGMPVKDQAVFRACLPEELAHRIDAAEVNMMSCFGSASMMGFGKLCINQNGRLASTITTAILFTPSSKVRQYRGYWDTLQANQALGDPDALGDFYMEFSHPIPGTGESLPLMQIGTPERLKADYLARFSNPSAFEHEYADIYAVPFYGPIQLLFLHPPYNAAYQEQLFQCLQPYWDTVTTPPAEHPEPGQPLSAEKEDALISIYWLLAQTTPPDRGGSAFARVILEHLSHVLQTQGYNCELPYTAEGIDLWAQAVTLPLEDDTVTGTTGFKSRFKSGVFFDLSADKQRVMAALRFNTLSNGEAAPGL